MPLRPRVRLVAATVPLLDALVNDPDGFAGLIGSPVPDGWPEFPEAIAVTVEYLNTASAAERPWSMQFFIDDATGALIGSGGYTGPPSDGAVEIGYEVAPAFRGLGLGAAAARALVERAFAATRSTASSRTPCPAPTPPPESWSPWASSGSASGTTRRAASSGAGYGRGRGRPTIPVPRSQEVLRMPEELSPLDVRTRERWRQWLSEHHASSPGVWLVRHKQHTGVESIPYEDLVREALCFGWIDSLVKRLDDDRYATKVTPRKPTSKWSDLNRRRWHQLQAAGRLAPAGLAAAPTENSYPARPSVPELPDYIADAFRAVPDAWRHFEALPPTSRRDFVVWIHTAKRPETRQRRMRESIALLAAGKRLGLK